MNIILELAGGVFTIAALFLIVGMVLDIAVLIDNLPKNRHK